MQSVLDGVTLGTAHSAEGHDPTADEGDHNIEGRCESLQDEYNLRCMRLIGPQLRKEYPVLNAVLSWLEAQKKTDLRTLLGEHAF